MNWDGLLKLIFIFLLAFVPSLIWLSFYLKKDKRPEPRRFLIWVFFLGGLSTLLGAEAENVWFHPWVQGNPNRQIAGLLFIFLYPFIEEICKFLGARLGTIKNKYFMDEATDPMIYLVVSALGFAAAENLRIFFGTVFGNIQNLSWHGLLNMSFAEGVLTSLVLTGLIRFAGTVFLHSLSSASLGYFWGLSRLSNNRIKTFLFCLPAGFIIATVLHSFYNYFVLNAQSNIFYTVSLIIFLIIGAMVISRGFRQLQSYQQLKR
jgi:RsiW-degrading membrane proteinase PrsW (M82 family)